MIETKEGRRRVVIEGVWPEIDTGRFPIKRVVGEKVVVELDAFADGHDALCCVLLHRQEGDATWTESPMLPLVNDRWRGEFTVTRLGRAEYTVLAWVDAFQSWLRDLHKRADAQQADLDVNLRVGAMLIRAAGQRAAGADAVWLTERALVLESDLPLEEKLRHAFDVQLDERMAAYPDRQYATRHDKALAVIIDPPKARFSTWYELFPRSWGSGGAHGTFRDVENVLPRIAELGFDVLYLPPIHPIGVAYRKGKNNSTTCTESDPGSPWAIGSAEGGHDAIHPELGTMADFRRLVQKAREFDIDIALDLAFQCSPDHPWVRLHPAWFKHRPDGSIQYAENPPKKYQDIYPLDFESDDWQGLWQALRDVVLHWINQGVTIFRVDNPHTKSFPFWEWLIGQVKQAFPQTIFLSEAFTRPKVMERLAKLGFTQSYTYFTWRNSKHELTQYFSELAAPQKAEFFRPNLWPNTPDILPEFLQWSGRPGFIIRLVLAATLGASYGIYGPAFELCENRPLAQGKEEYLDSEKYEIKQWQLDHPDALDEIIARVNRIRKQNTALQSDRGMCFHANDNEQLLCYSKRDSETGNTIVTMVNLDPYHAQSGWFDLDLNALGIDPREPYQMHDLLGDGHYVWQGSRNFVALDPHVVPAHVFRVRQRVRTEQQFEYYL